MIFTRIANFWYILGTDLSASTLSDYFPNDFFPN